VASFIVPTRPICTKRGLQTRQRPFGEPKLPARRPGSLVGVRMLKTAWVCPRLEVPPEDWHHGGRRDHRTPIRTLSSTNEYFGQQDHRGHMWAPTRAWRSPARSAASAAARWCCRAPIRIPAAPAFGKHRLPKQGARDRRDDRHRARWPDFANGVTIADPMRADGFLQIGPWRHYGKRRRAGKRVTLRRRARHRHVGRDRDQCQRIFHRRDRPPGSITGAGKPRPIAAACCANARRKFFDLSRLNRRRTRSDGRAH
jgi:hypothetical protein